MSYIINKNIPDLISKYCKRVFDDIVKEETELAVKEAQVRINKRILENISKIQVHETFHPSKLNSDIIIQINIQGPELNEKNDKPKTIKR